MADKKKKPKKEIVEFGELELSDSDGTIDEGEAYQHMPESLPQMNWRPTLTISQIPFEWGWIKVFLY